ncbi:unnamed protein product [Echinostoma caproni]|uniref:Transmembrane protein n=1 Tax=Echinostoma caproni TaxID=27848 RepID=A0A183AST5_9TREM|nr:unnamed protein product [Echinostoma caproni]
MSNAEVKRRFLGTSSTLAPNAASADHSSDVLSVLERNQSEGHTAALILAFSLGLVCCFIALLIIEWRRRSRLHGWAASRRRQNNVSVLFSDRRKLSVPGNVSGTRRSQKRTKSFRDPGGYVAVETDPDDEDKLVQDGLVL